MPAETREQTKEERVCAILVTVAGFWFMIQGIALNNAKVFIVGVVVIVSDTIVLGILRGVDNASR